MSEVSAADLAGHEFVRGLPPGDIAQLAGAASYASIPAGRRLFEEGGQANRFWLIRTGHVALDLHVAGAGQLIIETIGDQGLVGISWAAPSGEWQYGAEAVTPTEAFEFDAPAVIACCDADPAFGYRLIRKLLAEAARRMHASRIRMLDLYAAPGQPAQPAQPRTP